MHTSNIPKILLPLSVVEGRMVTHEAQGPRIVSTVQEMVQYGYDMMLLRIDQRYQEAPVEVQQVWEKHADDYVNKARTQLLIPSTEEERQLVKRLADTMELQRHREQEMAHATQAATLAVWMEAIEHAEKYLTA